MSLKNKSVLVTGGAGFIGSHLVDRLISEEPEAIVVVDNLFLGKDENLRNAKNRFPELKIFHNALLFSKVRIRDCMIPRTEIEAIDINGSMEELQNKFISTGYSKIIRPAR